MLIRILLFVGLLLSLNGQANLFNTSPRFLPSEQAFVLSVEPHSDHIVLNWQIAEGYYLYHKEMAIVPHHAKVGEVRFPASELHQDEFFGNVSIFRHQLRVVVPILSQQTDAQLEVRYQGCTKGFCYPPERQIVPLTKQQGGEKSEDFAKNDQQNNMLSSTTQPDQSEQIQLADRLASSQFSVMWFLVLGLGLAFTPCVLPMLPLLSAIVIGAKQRPNAFRAFLLSLTYVQGMALTYTMLGLIVAAIGLPFQIALQSPPVLIALSVLFVVLSLSMFGLFRLELPHRWQQTLNQLSQQQSGGQFPSVFVMGMIAGLVASPCTSAPLSGALLYVVQSGDLFKGGGALYLLAIGMGMPLVLVTLFGNRILPASGEWLVNVKTFFGFVMLAVPIFLMSRLVSVSVEWLLWSSLAIAVLFWLNNQFLARTGWQYALKMVLFVGVIVSGKPFMDYIWSSPAQIEKRVHFQRITDYRELSEQLSLAHRSGKKVMLDLYANWCVACKELEKFTFSDPNVQAELEKMQVLQVDMTRNSVANDEWMKQLHVLGLPTIVFFDENGNELTQKRITGFMPASEFLQHVNSLP